MSSDTSGHPVLRTLGRLFLVLFFLITTAGSLFAVHFINKTLKRPPSQVYVPVVSSDHAGASAAELVRSPATHWNLYRSDTGFALAAPATFTMPQPHPPVDLYLAAGSPQGRAVIRVASLGKPLGAVPFLAWKMAVDAPELPALVDQSFGKIQNARADAFVAGWFDYQRDDNEGTLTCIETADLLSNVPKAIEVCSTYGTEYDTALLKVSLLTSEASQKSVDYIDSDIEAALDAAFSQQKAAAPDSTPVKTKSTRSVKPNAAAPDAASDVATLPQLPITSRQSWDETRSVDCYRTPIAEIEGCYETDAQEKTESLLSGGSQEKPHSSAAQTDQPGVDVVGPVDGEEDPVISPSSGASAGPALDPVTDQGADPAENMSQGDSGAN